jgi:hypothetical protein
MYKRTTGIQDIFRLKQRSRIKSNIYKSVLQVPIATGSQHKIC